MTERAVVGGAISNGGNLQQWCLRELDLEKAAAENALDRVAAATDALTVLPFWVSERSPRPGRKICAATIIGLTPVTTAEEIVRAIGTSTFYRLAGILDALQTAERRAEELLSSAACCIRGIARDSGRCARPRLCGFVANWKARSGARRFMRWKN